MLQQSHPYPPISLVASKKSTEIFNPKPIPLQPLQCAMCGQLKSSHPSGPNYSSACRIVRHNLVFCRKVMAFKKSTSTPTRGNNNKKRDDNQKKNENLKILRHLKKKLKLVNMATEDLMYDSDAHVNMSRITSEALNLAEDSECSPSPAAQPSPDVPPLPPLPLSEASITPLTNDNIT